MFHGFLFLINLLLSSTQELFPVNKQNVEHFSKYFNEAGLKELSDFLRVQQSLGTRKELQKELQERLSQECPIREVNALIFIHLLNMSSVSGTTFDFNICLVTSHSDKLITHKRCCA